LKTLIYTVKYHQQKEFLSHNLVNALQKSFQMTYLITVSKVHPITCHEGIGASQLYLFLTSELEGVGWSTPCPGHLTPGEENWYLLYTRLDEPWGWPEHVQKISPPPGLEPPTTQPIVGRYTSHATAASTIMVSSQGKK
jgi:hypothetical protein